MLTQKISLVVSFIELVRLSHPLFNSINEATYGRATP